MRRDHSLSGALVLELAFDPKLAKSAHIRPALPSDVVHSEFPHRFCGPPPTLIRSRPANSTVFNARRGVPDLLLPLARFIAMSRQPSQPFRSRTFREISLDSALVPIICASLLYAVSWIMGCATAPSTKSGGGKKPNERAESVRHAEENSGVPPISGRKLTLEKMAQRAATSLQYSNPEYGVAFDAPKGYVLKEGELPEMDRGLGYLGPIPMHFAQPGGIRLATVEPPQGIHLGTNFVNEFLTVSAHYDSTEAVCADFNIPEESRGAPVTRTVDGIEFHGLEEQSAASMHQYTGVYLHAYRNETCYEIGYGVATAGESGGLKNINRQNLLHKLDRTLDNVRIGPPAFERSSTTD